MELVQSVIESVITIPVWLLASSLLLGALLGMTFLLLAMLVLGQAAKHKAMAIVATQGVAAGRITDGQSKDDDITDAPSIVQELSVVQQPEPVKARQAEAVSRKPVPPVRQHYWYYVSGVSGRFTTLREALTASGVDVPGDKALDWKKLTSDTRAGIKRFKVDAKQPEMETVVEMAEQVPVEQAPVERAVVRQEEVLARPKRKLVVDTDDSESVIRKSIGHGAFVTIKRKSR